MTQNYNDKQIKTLYNLTGSYAGVSRQFGISAPKVKKIIGEPSPAPSYSLFLNYSGLIPQEHPNRVYIGEDELENLFLKVLDSNGQL